MFCNLNFEIAQYWNCTSQASCMPRFPDPSCSTTVVYASMLDGDPSSSELRFHHVDSTIKKFYFGLQVRKYCQLEIQHFNLIKWPTSLRSKHPGSCFLQETPDAGVTLVLESRDSQLLLASPIPFFSSSIRLNEASFEFKIRLIYVLYSQ